MPDARIADLEAEVERLNRECAGRLAEVKEWRRISAEQQADYGQLQTELEALRAELERWRYCRECGSRNVTLEECGDCGARDDV